MWIAKVPEDIIDDHNDTFDYSATSLFLAMFQISGAVVSIQTDWPSIFDELGYSLVHPRGASAPEEEYADPAFTLRLQAHAITGEATPPMLR